MLWTKHENYDGCTADKPWGIVNDEDGTLVDSYATEAEADARLAAAAAGDDGDGDGDAHAHTGPPADITGHLRDRHGIAADDVPDGPPAAHAKHEDLHGGDIGKKMTVDSPEETDFISETPWDGSSSR